MTPSSSENNLSRIGFLLQNLNDGDFDSVLQELREVLKSQAVSSSSSCLPQEMEKLNFTDAYSDNYADDVEAELNLYFHYMFSGQLRIDTMIKMLARFKQSSEKRDQSLFKRILATMFEEFKFFSKYPDMQLKIAASVLGSLIKHQLVTQLMLGICLRGVLDALAKPTDSKMFGFGIMALEQFVERIIEWPHYCNHILQISHLRATHPDLIKSIEGALKKISAVVAEIDALHQNALVESSASAMSMEAPESEIQDSISFIMNNLSPTNIDDKAKQFIGIIKEQHYPWFARYLVVRRISIETNFLDLYLSFLDEVDLKPLNKEIVDATYKSCKALLKSDFIKSSVEERMMLKSLGSWLGKITIGKNHFLTAREIDPKSLLVEAYEKGRMIVIVPFISKILQSCSNSIAFRPPNPWTVGILKLLAEIYDMLNLKMDLQFEINGIFRDLGLDRKEFTPDSLLKDKIREVEGNTDFVHDDYGSSRPQEVISTQSKDEAPESEIRNEMSSILNSLSPKNIDDKANQFTRIAKPQNYPWCAQFIVKRVSIETNLHDLYLKFLDRVNQIPLNREILNATFENCKVLLKSDLIRSSVVVRWKLKNLGSWLGKIAIGKNQVLRIDLKSLIVEAYEKGLMSAIIPFISKILESCSKGAYQPPNTWTVGILGLFAEIYGMPNLKMNLKIEIEVLFKNLGVNLKDIPLTHLFKNKAPKVEGNPDFSLKDCGSPQPKVMICKLSKVEANIERLVVINKSLWAYGLDLPLQWALPMAMNRAVNDMLASIVPRSVSIATQTTKELIRKDYSMESDETLMCDAAYSMVARLASSHSHVTSKEPLRSCLSSLIGTSLSRLGSNTSDRKILEQAAQLVTVENLDLASALIEQAATEQAVQAIDGEIARTLYYESSN